MTREQAEGLLYWFGCNKVFLEAIAKGGEPMLFHSRLGLDGIRATIDDLRLLTISIKPTPTYRPYNREEWERLVCTPVRYKEDDSERVVSVESVRLNVGKEIIVKIDGAWTSPKDALNTFEHLDGTPCGVKEGE